MNLYAIYEKVPGSYYRQIDEQEAKTGAAAIRITRRSQRERGNTPPTGTKFKAVKLRAVGNRGSMAKLKQIIKANPPRSWTKVKAVRVMRKGGRDVLEIKK